MIEYMMGIRSTHVSVLRVISLFSWTRMYWCLDVFVVATMSIVEQISPSEQTSSAVGRHNLIKAKLPTWMLIGQTPLHSPSAVSTPPPPKSTNHPTFQATPSPPPSAMSSSIQHTNCSLSLHRLDVDAQTC